MKGVYPRGPRGSYWKTKGYWCENCKSRHGYLAKCPKRDVKIQEAESGLVYNSRQENIGPETFRETPY